MMKYVSIILVCSSLIISCASREQQGLASDRNPVDYVNPFIGTGGHGHTFPGATLPFGMMQLSPDTRLEGWDGCGGYHDSDSIVYGFSHTHLSGTGVSDYGDILLKPCVGDVKFDNGYKTSPSEGYASYFNKETEVASPGYYAMSVEEGIDVELTSTLRAGMHKYTWSKADNPHVMLDLHHRDFLLDANITVENDSTVTGFRSSKAWADDQRVYFCMEFSRPMSDSGLGAGLIQPAPDSSGKAVTTAVFDFDISDGESLLVRVGISAVDVEGARNNLRSEIDHWDFEKVKKDAAAEWEKELAKITVEGKSEEDKTVFYTALYHTMIAPNLYSDVDGRYRKTIPKSLTRPDHRIGEVEKGDHQYTVFSLWDTYRATHPLYTLIQRKRTGEFIRTFLRQYEDGGQLPVWELASTYTGCMIGYHSVPVIADAYAKGIQDFDTELAMQAMLHSAEMDVLGLPDYREKGFMATGDEPESVSKTLEYAYDDWCISDFADRLGKQEIAATYRERAQYYKNLFNAENGFLQGRSNGGWYGPFRPEEVNFNYTEANGWQYSLAVPQDVNGLIDLMGGDSAFCAHLDKMFSTDSETSGRHQVDITGLIGQYAHGNEPSHHMAYLYAYAGRPYRTQELTRQIMDSLYWNAPDGLSGNEDCGQMSAWYVMSAMGIYPVCPGSEDYVFGSPKFETADLALENGKHFVFKADGLQKGPYIQSVTLNGKAYSKGFITHSRIMEGGELIYQMGAEPNKDWAADSENRPSQRIKEEGFAVSPTITAESRTFHSTLEVEIHSPQAEVEIHYTMDGSEPTENSPRYEQVLTLENTATIRAIAIRDGKPGKIVKAQFYKVEGNRSIRIDSEYANQYSAGGDNALIDMIIGSPEFTTGDWQGYREDLDVTVDLGESMSISRISLGANQNIKSWIWFPDEVVISIGEQPDRMVALAPILNTFPEDNYGAFVKRFEREFRDTKARYVRVQAKQKGVCPDWHLGAGGKTWLFFDELIIE